MFKRTPHGRIGCLAIKRLRRIARFSSHMDCEVSLLTPKSSMEYHDRRQTHTCTSADSLASSDAGRRYIGWIVVTLIGSHFPTPGPIRMKFFLSWPAENGACSQVTVNAHNCLRTFRISCNGPRSGSFSPLTLYRVDSGRINRPPFRNAWSDFDNFWFVMTARKWRIFCLI